MDMTWFTAAGHSFSASTQIIEALFKLKLAADVQAKITELQREILSAQGSAMTAYANEMTLIKRVDDLEKQVVNFENWEAERQNYELLQVESGVFAYAPKPGMERGQPVHWLCTNCFENRKKSILQARAREHREPHKVFCCPACRAEISVDYRRGPGRDPDSRIIPA